jgi:flagellar motor switch protein FliG
MPPPEVLQGILNAVLRKVASVAENPDLALADRQAERTAALLRQLDRNDRKEILTALEQTDPTLAERVKELLYRMEDLLRLQDRSVQKVLAEIDSRTLALAVKTTSEEVRDKIRRNLSRRAKEALEEELEFLTGVSQAQIQQAQKQLTQVLQRLDLAGELAYEGE